MNTHDTPHQDPATIAADLARERQSLATTIDRLRDRITVDALLTDAMDIAKTRIGPYTTAIDGAVRANPVAAAMVGVGVAWLIFGHKRHNMPTDALAGTKHEALARWEDEGGPVAPLPGADTAWIAETDSLRDRAAHALSRIEAEARQRLRPAADLARARAEVVAQTARDIRHAMANGLSTLSAEARNRILAAREAAYLARVATLRKGAALVEDRPYLTGAVALAAGAALAASLPQTEIENRVLGPERDRLLAEAQRMLDAERARAGQVATALADAVTSDVQQAAAELARGAA